MLPPSQNHSSNYHAELPISLTQIIKYMYIWAFLPFLHSILLSWSWPADFYCNKHGFLSSSLSPSSWQLFRFSACLLCCFSPKLRKLFLSIYIYLPHTCDPNIWGWRQEDYHEFETSPGYIVSSSLHSEYPQPQYETLQNKTKQNTRPMWGCRYGSALRSMCCSCRLEFGSQGRSPS